MKRLEQNPFSLGSMSKKIEGVKNLFELRIKGKNKNIRIFYCFRKDRIIILQHGFVKKSKKIPLKELKLVVVRKEEVENE